MSSCIVFQGCAVGCNDGVLVAWEGGGWAQHDCTVPMLTVSNGARMNAVTSVAGAGQSGKGNTGKILTVDGAGNSGFTYGFSGAQPPFIAGVTIDANPITLGGVNYTVAALPAVAGTTLVGSKRFPYDPTALANGVVIVALGAFGPAGSAATPVRWAQIPDGAGGFFTVPSFT